MISGSNLSITEMKVEKIYSGKTHSYVVVNDLVIGFGVDKNGKLGIGNSAEAIILPMIIKSLSNVHISGISIGNSHCLAWDKKGQIYSWGDGIFRLYIIRFKWLTSSSNRLKQYDFQ